MSEQWKEIPGFEGAYMVSDHGRIKALARAVRTCPLGDWTTRQQPEHVLRMNRRRGGYMKVRLSQDMRQKDYWVHRLVAAAFIPNPDGLPFVNHIDANPANNCVDNLEWVTHRQNMEHAARMGLMVSSSGPGEESPAHKLKELDVVRIKLRLMRGERICDILRDYPSIQKGTIGHIKAGRTWSHVVITEEIVRHYMSQGVVLTMPVAA